MAFGFKGHFWGLKFDRPKFIKEMDRRALQVLREAARQWILAAYIRVPVWTGTARGSFKYAQGRAGPAAGQFISVYLKVAVPIGPTRTHDGGPVAARDGKGPEVGGRKARYTISTFGMKYNFTFSTALDYFELNDQQSGRPPSHTRPWNSFQAGDAAFHQYITGNIKRVVPRVTDFMIRTRISLS